MTICQRCSDIIREAHEGPTRSVTSEPGHALQILAKDAAEWKERAIKAEGKLKSIQHFVKDPESRRTIDLIIHDVQG